jgi:hypothetical protein
METTASRADTPKRPPRAVTTEWKADWTEERVAGVIFAVAGLIF